MLTGTDADLETIPVVKVLGVVARAEDGTVNYYSTATDDGVSVHQAEQLEEAIEASPERWVNSFDLFKVFDGVDIIDR